MTKQCSNCHFWRPSPDAPEKEGECHFNAPLPLTDAGRQKRAFWPWTYAIDWCGCFFPKEGPRDAW